MSLWISIAHDDRLVPTCNSLFVIFGRLYFPEKKCARMFRAVESSVAEQRGKRTSERNERGNAAGGRMCERIPAVTSHTHNSIPRRTRVCVCDDAECVSSTNCVSRPMTHHDVKTLRLRIWNSVILLENPVVVRNEFTSKVWSSITCIMSSPSSDYDSMRKQQVAKVYHIDLLRRCEGVPMCCRWWRWRQRSHEIIRSLSVIVANINIYYLRYHSHELRRRHLRSRT